MTQIVVVSGSSSAVQTGGAGGAVAGSCQDRSIGPVGHAAVALQAHARRAAASSAARWTLTTGTLSEIDALVLHGELVVDVVGMGEHSGGAVVAGSLHGGAVR